MNDLGPFGEPSPPPEIQFRPGPGGKLTLEWAAYMMNLWWAAKDKKFTFAEAAKQATLHFMVGDGGQS